MDHAILSSRKFDGRLPPRGGDGMSDDEIMILIGIVQTAIAVYAVFFKK